MAAGWVEKNLDRVPALCYQCIAGSGYLDRAGESSILLTFKDSRAPPDDDAPRGKKPSPATLVSNFRTSLASLVDNTLTNKECRNQFVSNRQQPPSLTVAMAGEMHQAKRCQEATNLQFSPRAQPAAVHWDARHPAHSQSRLPYQTFAPRFLRHVCLEHPLRVLSDRLLLRRYKCVATSLDGVTDAASLVAALRKRGELCVNSEICVLSCSAFRTDSDCSRSERV